MERIVVITVNGKEHWSGVWWKAWKIMLALIHEGVSRIDCERT